MMFSETSRLYRQRLSDAGDPALLDGVDGAIRARSVQGLSAPDARVDALLTDVAPLFLASEDGGRLATVVGIDGGFSRGLGSQLAVRGDTRLGDLADHCLEAAVATELAKDEPRRVLRFGRGSPFVDLRLACGGGIDILVDPAPNAADLRVVASAVQARRRASLTLKTDTSDVGRAFRCLYMPPLRLIVIGGGSEAKALNEIARAAGFEVRLMQPPGAGQAADVLPLASQPDIEVDWRTAVVVLFHDHEWERGVLPWALRSEARYVGVQGSEVAQASRLAWLDREGLADAAARKLRAPVGLIKRTRTPAALAISILAELIEFDGEALARARIST